MVWWRGRKWNHIKKDFWSWSVFSSQKIDFPFYLKRLLELFGFLDPFLYAPFLEDSGVLIIFEEKITSSKTSFQMAWHGMAWSWLWIYRRWTHILKWSYARQYCQTMIMEMGDLWIYLQLTHIPEWKYACQYFWVRLANKFFWVVNHFQKNFQKSNGHIP
jgi:hypothetical protein